MISGIDEEFGGLELSGTDGTAVDNGALLPVSVTEGSSLQNGSDPSGMIGAIGTIAWENGQIPLSLLEGLPTPIFCKQLDGIFLYCNEAYCRYIGRPLREILGKKVQDLVPSELGPAFDASDKVLLATRMPQQSEYDGWGAGHENSRSVVVKNLYCDHTGNPVGIVGLVLDITDRKRSEDALRLSEERLELAMQGADLGFWDWDLATSHVERNEKVRLMLGYNKGELAATNEAWSAIIHPDDLPLAVQGLEAHLEGRTESMHGEYRVRAKNGEWLWVQDRGRVVERDANGRPVRVTGTVMLTHARKLTELRLDEARFRDQLRAGLVSTFLSTGSFDAILRLAMQELAAHITETRVVYLVANREAQAQVVAAQPMCSLRSSDPISFNLKQSPALHDAFENRKCFSVPDARQNSALGPLRGQLIALDCRAALASPMQTDEGLVGIIAMISSTPRQWTPDETLALEAVSETLSPILRQICSEKRRAEALRALSLSEQRYALALRATNEGLWDWDIATDELFMSDRCLQLHGLPSRSGIKTLADRLKVVHPEDQSQFEQALREHLNGKTETLNIECRELHADGHPRWMQTRGLAVRDPNSQLPIRLVGSTTDITERKLAEERLVHDALHDLLTGLPNRSLLLDRIGCCLNRARRAGEHQFAVLFMDIDRFKNINDGLGHQAGDSLLRSFSARVREALRTGDTLARLGGDEFVILLEEIENDEDAIRVAHRIRSLLDASLDADGKEVHVRVSLGITFGPNGYANADEMLRDADTALFRAKDLGRDQCVIFNEDMHHKAFQRLNLETELRQAIERSQITAHYQPIVRMADRTIQGFEALARWNSPERGFVSPGEFIPTAEESGLINLIGRDVLRCAAAEIRRWQATCPEYVDLTVNVNLSARQISQASIVVDTFGTLSDAMLDTRHLKFEITESFLMNDPELAKAILLQLKDLGIRIVLDDFGTGFSSLSYLLNFPIDELKIDRSFVRNLKEGTREHSIVKTIVRLAKSLDLVVTAEGVETEEQFELLKAEGCDYAQGFLFSRPVSSARAEMILRRISPASPCTTHIDSELQEV